jgi:hypothetical protein
MADRQLPTTFIANAADVLGHTKDGLSGSDIAKLMRSYGGEYEVEVPYPIYPNDAPNKRTALLENLSAFSGAQQHRILRELCDWKAPEPDSPERRRIKIQLATTYRDFGEGNGASPINDTLIEETRHWLDVCPEALGLYNEAIGKYRAGVFERNVVDDMRLSLELLLKKLFGNDKSLENQIPAVGQLIKSRGGSPELVNMFTRLVDYYCKYQNSYVKHADAVIGHEIEFLLEITSSFMKHMVRMDGEGR